MNFGVQKKKATESILQLAAMGIPFWSSGCHVLNGTLRKQTVSKEGTRVAQVQASLRLQSEASPT